MSDIHCAIMEPVFQHLRTWQGSDYCPGVGLVWPAAEEEADVGATHWPARPPLCWSLTARIGRALEGRPPVHTGLSFGSGCSAGSGFPVFASPRVPWTRRLRQASEEVQGVDSHVPREEHVEAAEPEQLASVAGHGSLGPCHFFAGEHKEDIPGVKQRKGQVQKGDVLAQHIH